jgi:protein involved in polysaccharide export with SLBB domain
MNILNAVAISGGFTYRANTKYIEIIRNQADSDLASDDISSLNVKDSKIMLLPNSQVLPGDIIRVKERFF